MRPEVVRPSGVDPAHLGLDPRTLKSTADPTGIDVQRVAGATLLLTW